MEPKSFYFSPDGTKVSRSDLRRVEPIRCWCQPSDRWVHIPVHLLHNEKILAPFVAHLGSFASAFYPTNQKERNVILVFVKNCLITKVPHIPPVCDEGKVIPVKIQVLFGEKMDEEGVIFDPLVSRDSFFLPASGGVFAVNSGIHSRSADLNTSEIFPGELKTNTRDKSKQISKSFTAANRLDSDWSYEEIRGPQDQVKLLKFSLCPKRGEPAMSNSNWDQILGSPPAPPTISYCETAVAEYRKHLVNHDCDLSGQERSHQPSNFKKPVLKATAKSTSPFHINILVLPTLMPENDPPACKTESRSRTGAISKFTGQKMEPSEQGHLLVAEPFGTATGLKLEANKEDLLESLHINVKEGTNKSSEHDTEEVKKNLGNHPQND